MLLRSAVTLASSPALAGLVAAAVVALKIARAKAILSLSLNFSLAVFTELVKVSCVVKSILGASPPPQPINAKLNNDFN